MANPIVTAPTGTKGEPLIHGQDQLSPIDPSTGYWRTASEVHFLRAIYFELRIMNQLLADGLNVQTQLTSYRQNASAVFPDTNDQD